MSGYWYRGKDSRAETDFDRWLARAQHRAKMRESERQRFGHEDFDGRTTVYDEVEERYLTEDEV